MSLRKQVGPPKELRTAEYRQRKVPNKKRASRKGGRRSMYCLECGENFPVEDSEMCQECIDDRS